MKMTTTWTLIIGAGIIAWATMSGARPPIIIGASVATVAAVGIAITARRIRRGQ